MCSDSTRWWATRVAASWRLNIFEHSLEFFRAVVPNLLWGNTNVIFLTTSQLRKVLVEKPWLQWSKRCLCWLRASVYLQNDGAYGSTVHMPHGPEKLTHSLIVTFLICKINGLDQIPKTLWNLKTFFSRRLFTFPRGIFIFWDICLSFWKHLVSSLLPVFVNGLSVGRERTYCTYISIVLRIITNPGAFLSLLPMVLMAVLYGKYYCHSHFANGKFRKMNLPKVAHVVQSRIRNQEQADYAMVTKHF